MPIYEDIRIKTSDGLLLHAYFIPYIAPKGLDLNGERKKFSNVTLVYCHANSGNMVREGITFALTMR